MTQPLHSRLCPENQEKSWGNVIVGFPDPIPSLGMCSLVKYASSLDCALFRGTLTLNERLYGGRALLSLEQTTLFVICPEGSRDHM